MKRILTFVFALTLSNGIFAATHNIVISGLTYSPASITAEVGDVVNIEASSTHPLVQVDLSTWNEDGNTPVGGGWGVVTATHSFTITQLGDIYFVCQNHVQMGMKGSIAVFSPTGVPEHVIGSLISVFPTPVENGNFTVITGTNAPEGLSLEIYSTTGQLVEAHKLSGGINSLATNAPAGAYMYAVTNNKRVVFRTGKLLVTN